MADRNAKSDGAEPVGAKVKRIRALNDACRAWLLPACLMLTAGVRALPGDRLIALLEMVQAFNPGNNPYGEHDFGSVEQDGQTYFWKIDYYDLDRLNGSPDPSDATATRRVLTVMRGDEY